MKLEAGIYKFNKDPKLIANPAKKSEAQSSSPLFLALAEELTTDNESEWEIYREAFRGIAKSKCIRIGTQF